MQNQAKNYKPLHVLRKQDGAFIMASLLTDLDSLLGEPEQAVTPIFIF